MGDEYDVSGAVMARKPLPRWLRYLAPHPVAYDRLSTIFRYRPFHSQFDLDPNKPGYLADTLSTGRIFVPTFGSLNDPWEAAPAIENYLWRRDLHADIASFLGYLAPDVLSPEDQEKLNQEIRAFNSDALLLRIQEELHNQLRSGPILSMSDRGDIFLMWSYYGQGHKGYAFVFDAKALPFSAAVRAKYARIHPRIYLTRKNRNGMAMDILATKARQWRHEREWRIITTEGNAEALGFRNFERASEYGYYGTVSLSSIIGVIIGDRLYRGPESQPVLDLLAQHSSQMKFWTAEIDRREFRINLRPIRFS